MSVFDRSYLFGEGIFETMRSFEGKFPFMQAHLGRLEWSTTFLDIPYPEYNFAEICPALLDKNNFKEGRFKILASKTEAGEPNCTIYCEELDDSKIPETFTLKTAKSFCNDALPIAALKSTNSLVKLLAREDAIESGFSDAILLNSKGKVTEATRANIFWVDKDGKLFSVMAEQGLLSGLMGKTIKDVLKENQLACKEAVITPEELSSSREVFITNSVICIRPVVKIDKRQISGGEMGPITLMINDLWKKKIKELVT